MEQAIIRLDPAVFQSLEDVETVLQCVPTEDEQKLLQSYVHSGGKAEALSTAELFCLDLMKVSSGLSLPFATMHWICQLTMQLEECSRGTQRG